MASLGPETHPERFEYVNRESIIKYLICRMCDNPFLHPVEAPCGQGHIFCSDCYSQNKDLGPCPECNNPFCTEESKPVPQISRMVEDLAVFCSRREKNCDWQGMRKDLKDHLARDCMTLNIGGRIFCVSRNVLTVHTPKSSLAKYFLDDYHEDLLDEDDRPARDADGNIFFDRDPAMFEVLLHWLRSCRDGLAVEATSEIVDNALIIERQFWDLIDEFENGETPDQPCLYRYCDLSMPYIQRLLCAICQQPIQQPVTTSCLHTFCQHCLGPIGEESTCPTCSSAIVSLSPAASTLVDLVDDLQVSCGQKLKGCLWAGPRRDFRSHYLNDCVFGRKGGEIVTVDIGGVVFTTFQHTLARYKGEAELLSPDKDPDGFRALLCLLRTGQVSVLTDSDRALLFANWNINPGYASDLRTDAAIFLSTIAKIQETSMALSLDESYDDFDGDGSASSCSSPPQIAIKSKSKSSKSKGSSGMTQIDFSTDELFLPQWIADGCPMVPKNGNRHKFLLSEWLVRCLQLRDIPSYLPTLNYEAQQLGVLLKPKREGATDESLQRVDYCHCCNTNVKSVHFAINIRPSTREALFPGVADLQLCNFCYQNVFTQFNQQGIHRCHRGTCVSKYVINPERLHGATPGPIEERPPILKPSRTPLKNIASRPLRSNSQAHALSLGDDFSVLTTPKKGLIIEDPSSLNASLITNGGASSPESVISQPTITPGPANHISKLEQWMLDGRPQVPKTASKHKPLLAEWLIRCCALRTDPSQIGNLNFEAEQLGVAWKQRVDRPRNISKGEKVGFCHCCNAEVESAYFSLNPTQKKIFPEIAEPTFCDYCYHVMPTQFNREGIFRCHRGPSIEKYIINEEKMLSDPAYERRRERVMAVLTSRPEEQAQASPSSSSPPPTFPQHEAVENLEDAPMEDNAPNENVEEQAVKTESEFETEKEIPADSAPPDVPVENVEPVYEAEAPQSPMEAHEITFALEPPPELLLIAPLPLDFSPPPSPPPETPVEAPAPAPPPVSHKERRHTSSGSAAKKSRR